MSLSFLLTEVSKHSRTLELNGRQLEKQVFSRQGEKAEQYCYSLFFNLSIYHCYQINLFISIELSFEPGHEEIKK